MSTQYCTRGGRLPPTGNSYTLAGRGPAVFTGLAIDPRRRERRLKPLVVGADGPRKAHADGELGQDRRQGDSEEVGLPCTKIYMLCIPATASFQIANPFPVPDDDNASGNTSLMGPCSVPSLLMSYSIIFRG